MLTRTKYIKFLLLLFPALIATGCTDELVIPEYQAQIEKIERGQSLLDPILITGSDLIPDSISIYLDAEPYPSEYIDIKRSDRIIMYWPQDIWTDEPDSIRNKTFWITIINSNDTLLRETLSVNRVLVTDTVAIPGGTFQMGTPNGNADERPQHEVTISNDLVAMKFEFTNIIADYLDGQPLPLALANELKDYPISSISPTEAIAFANSLSAIEGFEPAYTESSNAGEIWEWNKEANGWRLPTEAEWEYLARYQSDIFPSDDQIDLLAWTAENSSGSIKEAGQKQPNGIGIHDMLGNVWEWCYDEYRVYTEEPITDPLIKPTSDSTFVKRGGDVRSGYWITRPTNRFYLQLGEKYENIGFRLVRNSN